VKPTEERAMPHTNDTNDTIEHVSWGDGEPIPATPFRVLVPGEATEQRLVVTSADMAVGIHVDEHTHHAEDQIMIVISGRLGATVGERRYEIDPGGVLLLPRGVPHSLWNLGDEDARLLDIYTPSGFEQVFAAAGAASHADVAPA
jgi:mannose-6-phosphate isomerase-like protein (cupin superfamily)